MISYFRSDGIHSCIFNGPNQNSHHRIDDSYSFLLGIRKRGSIVGLELTTNPDGTNGSLMLIYPGNAPLLIAKELSGEYVWFALSDNRDAPDFREPRIAKPTKI